MREIRLICKKELSRVLTDRKMLFSVFLLPAIIMVVVMNVMTSFSENLENDVKSHAPIVYLQNAPEGVEQYLKAYNEKMDLRTVDDEQKVTEEIRDGSADLWIAFPQDFLEQIEVYKTGDEIPQIKVYYNPSEEYSQAAYEGVAGVADQASVTQAADTLINKKVDCITNLTDNNVVGVLPSILEKTNAAGIPVYGSEIEQVKKGCVASAGIDYVELGKMAGKLAAQILKGEAKASDLPYETVTEYSTYINSDAASAMGITVPSDVAAKAIECK